MVSRTGAWDIAVTEEPTTPSLTIDNLAQGGLLKVTCQFSAKTMTNDLGDGFEFDIVADDMTHPYTPTKGLVQGSDNWQLYTFVSVFEVQTNHAEFNLVLDDGGMSGKGAMMNFLLMAEVL